MSFPASAIGIALALMFAAIFLLDWADKRRWITASSILRKIMLFAGAYCLAAGIYLALYWDNPMADTDFGTMVGYAHNPKQLIIVHALRLWPYVLIGYGGLVGVAGARQLWFRHRTEQRTIPTEQKTITAETWMFRLLALFPCLLVGLPFGYMAATGMLGINTLISGTLAAIFLLSAVGMVVSWRRKSSTEQRTIPTEQKTITAANLRVAVIFLVRAAFVILLTAKAIEMAFLAPRFSAAGRWEEALLHWAVVALFSLPLVIVIIKVRGWNWGALIVALWRRIWRELWQKLPRSPKPEWLDEWEKALDKPNAKPPV